MVLAVEEMNYVPAVQVSLPASVVSKRNKGTDAGERFNLKDYKQNKVYLQKL